jgi:type IV secretion system protein TrbB
MITQSHDEFLWRQAAELLQIARLLDGQPQEVSGNYHAPTRSCPVFAYFGAGAMQPLGIALPAARVEAGIRLLAASAGKLIECEAPFVNRILPNGGRFAASVEAGGISFSLRLFWGSVRALEEFIAERWQLAVIEEAIRRRFNIVATGGTSTGKTSFINALIAHLLKFSPHERLGTIEDEPELQIDAPNVIRRVVRGQADMRRHVREMLRMRPDRIIVGEVRGAEALDLLKAWNTGHSGGFTTIHANSAPAGLLRLESLIEEAGVPPSARLIAEAVDLLIFISRRPDGARRIAEMVRLQGCAPDGGYRLKPIIGVEDLSKS